jgi:hypothetical protein
MTFSGEFENTPVEVVEHIAHMIDAGLIDGETYPDISQQAGFLPH